jgi:hypothetical protein
MSAIRQLLGRRTSTPGSVSAPSVMPSWIRVVAAGAALLFAAVAVQVFMGRALTPLSQPLAFFAYPFLAITLFGWAWAHYRNAA